MKKWILHIILLAAATSCEEAIDWEIQHESSHKLVVECILTSENINHTVKLTKPIINLNEQAESISGAAVFLSDGENIMTTTESSASSGIYYANAPFIASINKMYYLYIEYDGQIFMANDYMVPVTPLQNIILHEHADYPDFYGITSYESDMPCMIEYYLDWTHFARYDTLYDGTGKAKIVDYTLSTIDVAEIFKPGKETIYFPEGTRIIRKKYSLSSQHQEFARSLLSETEWRGGYFDVLPGNTKTNLSEGALGFFGVCAVTSDTIYASSSYLQ